MNDITSLGIKHNIGNIGMSAGHNPEDIIWKKDLNRKHKSKVYDDKDQMFLRMVTFRHYEFYKNLV